MSRPTVEVLLAQAMTMYRDGDYEQAETVYGRVLQADQGNPHAMHLLGLIAHKQGNRYMAAALMERAAAINPYGQIKHNLGVVLSEMGDHNRALAGYRQALKLDPWYIDAACNLLFTLDMHPSASPEMLLKERRAFSERFCDPLTNAALPHKNDRNPGRRLRIGYLSGDFRRHSASMSFEKVIMGHDEAEFEVYLYSTASRHDDVSERFKARADVWCEVEQLTPPELAEVIRQDEIDVLVELSGFSGGNRIITLAQKPAPIQISGWGYSGGLGIKAIDYLVADDEAVEGCDEHLYDEKIMRLPCLFSYEPDGTPPPLREVPPEITTGYRTFGYLGRAIKLNDRVLAVWARILTELPGSRLILKNGDYREQAMRDRVGATLVALGVDPDRIDVRAESSRYDHLAVYNEVDVALDTFPSNGGMTTLDACLMGVPTVTLWGRRIQSRQSASVLEVLGYGQWVADIEDDYVSIAVGEFYSGVRPFLSETLLESVIYDKTRYVQAFERQVRRAWTRWCASGPTPLASIPPLIEKYGPEWKRIKGVRGVGGKTHADEHWLVVYANPGADTSLIPSSVDGVRVEISS